MKVCRVCKQEKPLSRYSIRTDGKQGARTRTECKDCLNISRKNQPKYGHWHKVNKDKVAAYMREFSLKRYWNMTQQDFDNMLAAQNGVCAICKTAEWVGRGKRAHVDHCHKTGKIRGLLCNLCNVAIGSFKESEESMLSAIEYLKKHK